MKIKVKICLTVIIIVLLVNPGKSAIFNIAQDAEGEAVYLFALNPATWGKPPFEMIQTSHPYNGVWNQYFTMGWNASAYGPPGEKFIPNEPAWVMGFENDFFDGTHHTMEWYLNYVSPDRASVPSFRPLYCSVYRDDNTSYTSFINLDVGDAHGSFRIFANAVSEWFAYLEVNSENTTIRNDLGVHGNIRLNRSGHYTALTMGDNENGSYPGIYLQTGGFHNWLISAQYHISNCLEITPSTEPGGAKYATPAFTVKPTGIGANLPAYPNNAAALAGGLVPGDFYRTGTDPDVVCVVH